MVVCVVPSVSMLKAYSGPGPRGSLRFLVPKGFDMETSWLMLSWETSMWSGYRRRRLNVIERRSIPVRPVVLDEGKTVGTCGLRKVYTVSWLSNWPYLCFHTISSSNRPLSPQFRILYQGKEKLRWESRGNDLRLSFYPPLTDIIWHWLKS
jgi:hypothetical protein